MIFQVILREYVAKRTNFIELRDHLKQLHAVSQIYSDGKYTKNVIGYGDYKNIKKLKIVNQCMLTDEIKRNAVLISYAKNELFIQI